jgi:hypothetical protein
LTLFAANGESVHLLKNQPISCKIEVSSIIYRKMLKVENLQTLKSSMLSLFPHNLKRWKKKGLLSNID